MTIKEYQEQMNVAIPEHSSEKDAVSHWVVGLTEEAGEVAGLIKHRYYCNEDIPDEVIAEELGDVLWYISALCNELGLNLTTVAELNLAKLKHRYNGQYSDDKVRDRHVSFENFKETRLYKLLVEKLKK